MSSLGAGDPKDMGPDDILKYADGNKYLETGA
jgi:hypothetical protein